MKCFLTCLIGWLLTAAPALAQAAESHGEESGGGHHGVATFLFEIVAILVAAKIGGELFERMKQPAVLGELVFGMVLGNLNLIGWTFMSGFKTDAMLALAAEIGASRRQPHRPLVGSERLERKGEPRIGVTERRVRIRILGHGHGLPI